MIELLEDLGRAWRIAQPNLEQCGLLQLEYDGLPALAANDALWHGLPAIADASGARREDVLRVVLDRLRGRLVIDTDVLSDATTREMKRTAQWLAYPWALEENDPVQRARLALLPGRDVPANQFAGNYVRLG